MKLNNNQKTSLSIALALMSKDIEFSRYNIKAVQNKSVYTINNHGGINYTIDFSNNKNSNQMFRDLIYYLSVERDMDICPTLEELKNDDLALTQFAKILNSFIDHGPDDTVLDYQKKKYEVTQLLNKIKTVAEMSEVANILNDEFLTLDSASFILHQCIVNKFDKNTLNDEEDVISWLEACQEGNKIHINEFKTLNEINWVDEKKTTYPHTSDAFNKNIAKLITLCILNPEVFCAIEAIGQFDNTIQFRTLFNTSYDSQMFIHDRQHAVTDFMNFRRNLYDQILNKNGFTETENIKDSEKEKIVFDIIKTNPKINIGYFGYYKSAMEDLSINFGRDQRILGAVALNLASVMGGYNITNDLSNLKDMDFDEVSDIFNRNYELISRHPSIALQVINIIENEKITSPSSFEDFLKSKFPNATIHAIPRQEDIPDEIKDILASLSNLLKQENATLLDLTNIPNASENIDALNDLLVDLDDYNPLRAGKIPELDDEGFPILDPTIDADDEDYDSMFNGGQNPRN